MAGEPAGQRRLVQGWASASRFLLMLWRLLIPTTFPFSFPKSLLLSLALALLPGEDPDGELGALSAPHRRPGLQALSPRPPACTRLLPPSPFLFHRACGKAVALSSHVTGGPSVWSGGWLGCFSVPLAEAVASFSSRFVCPRACLIIASL